MKHFKYRFILLLILAFIVCFGCIKNTTGTPDNDAGFLLKGVGNLTFLATKYPPTKLSVFGERAVVLATSLKNGDTVAGQSPIVACTTMENGNKVVVFGYTSFLTVDDIESKKFVSNILDWMSPENRTYNLGINNGSIDLTNKDNKSFKQMPLDLNSLVNYDIIVVDDINTIDKANLEKLKKFCKLRNRGLIMGISAYYNGYLNEKHMIKKNKLIGPSGIFWTSIWNDMNETILDVNEKMLPTTHVSYAMNKVRSGDNDQRYMSIIGEFIRFTEDNTISGDITSAPYNDAAILLKGVGNLTFLVTEYPPMKLSVFGNRAVVLAAALRNDDKAEGQSPIVACTTNENGNKFVVFGYTSFVTVNDTDSKKFVSNMLHWMSPESRTYNLGINKGLIDLNNADNKKFKQMPLDLKSLSKYDIIVVDDINTIDDANLEKLKNFSELSDKGLIMGISAYYEGYLNDKHMLKKNSLVGPSGIFWTSIWNDMERNKTNLDVNQEMLPTTHVSYAANKVRSGDNDQRYMKIIWESIRFTADNSISGFIKNITTPANNGVAILFKGVGKLRFINTFNEPTKLIVFGNRAVVLATMSNYGDETAGQSPIVARTTKENGNKVVVFGYTSFVKANDAESKQFVSNILNWMSPGNGPFILGMNKGSIELNNGDNKKFKQIPLSLESLNNYDIIVVDDINKIDDANLEKLQKFSELSDKGLIMGISNSSLNETLMLKKNKIIGSSGIFWAIPWNYMEGIAFEVNDEMLPTSHLSYAASELRSGNYERQYIKIVREFIRFVADDPISGYIKNIPTVPNNGAAILLNGLGKLNFLAAQYPPMKLSVFGKNAVVLAAALKNGDKLAGQSPIVACATRENRSKVVVFGYNSFVKVNDDESKDFVSNILNWMSPGNGTFNLGINNGLIDLNSKDSTKFKQMPLDLESLETLSKYDIIVVDDINMIDDINLEKLKQFSELSDKGLIMGISAYYEGYLNEKYLIKKNELIGPFGIFWTSMWIDLDENRTNLVVNDGMYPGIHVSYAVNKVKEGNTNPQYMQIVAEFMRFTADNLISGYIRNITTPPNNDAAILLKGVGTVNFLPAECLPTKLSVFGNNAVVLAAALRNGDILAGQSPIVACTTKENRNKIVVFGYNSFVKVNDIESKRFVSNILNWMSPGHGPYNVGINNGLIDLNNKDNTKFKQMPLDLKSLNNYDIIVVDDINTIDDTNLEKLIQFSELSDKGLIMGISAYYEGYLNETVMLKKNQLIGPIGIFWTSMWNEMEGTSLVVNEEMLPTAHVSYAVDKVRNGDYDQRYVRIFGEFVRFTTETAPATGFMSSLLQEYNSGKMFGNRTLPNLDNPISDIMSKQPIYFDTAIAQWIARYEEPDTIKAHPAAFYYPSLEFQNWGKPVHNQSVLIKPVAPTTFQDQPLLSKNFNLCQKFDDGNPEPLVVPPDTGLNYLWYPTGMYARPGEVVTLQFSEATNTSEIKVRIGINTDDLTFKDETLVRYPKIDMEKWVVNKSLKIASPFGGLMYIVLPINYDGEEFVVQFNGTYRAPTFIHGETSLDEWKTMISQPEAPWGELITRGVIDLMLPTDYSLKKIIDPEQILTQFNKGIEGVKYLGDLEVISAVAYAPDYRIVGWAAHDGYPIVILFDWLDDLVNSKQFCSVSVAWGWWHELGHNFQYDEMSMSNTGEVTNNFFNVYNIDTYCNLTVGDVILERNKNNVSFRKWEREGRPYSEWLVNNDLQLLMFLQLVDKYGWQSLRKLHTFYNQMRADGDTGETIPNDLSQRTDLLYVVYSQIVGENLSSFIKAWNVPLSKQAEECVAGFGLKMSSLIFCNPFNGTSGIQNAIGFNC